MVKIRVKNLTAAQLNWAVAQCEKLEIESIRGGAVWIYLKCSLTGEVECVDTYHPTTNWAQGGSIIEREGITIEGPAFTGDTWQAHLWTDQVVDFIVCEGATPLIAAMKCYVISKLGTTVEVPDALF